MLQFRKKKRRREEEEKPETLQDSDWIHLQIEPENPNYLVTLFTAGLPRNDHDDVIDVSVYLNSAMHIVHTIV